jgi:outer membrane protein insertion porin family
MYGFFDIGNVFGEDEKIRTSEFRSAVGVGLSWISPIGPLRIAYANPVKKFAGDRIQKLQFQIGTSF